MKFTQILKTYAGEYKKYLYLCPAAMIGEVAMETTIPLMTAKLIDEAIPAKDISQVLLYGGLMVLMALLSMGFTGAEVELSLKGAPEDGSETALIQYALKKLGSQR